MMRRKTPANQIADRRSGIAGEPLFVSACDPSCHRLADRTDAIDHRSPFIRNVMYKSLASALPLLLSVQRAVMWYWPSALTFLEFVGSKLDGLALLIRPSIRYAAWSL